MMSPHPKLFLQIVLSNPVNVDHDAMTHDSEIKTGRMSLRTKINPDPTAGITDEQLDNFAFDLLWVATRREALRRFLTELQRSDPKFQPCPWAKHKKENKDV